MKLRRKVRTLAAALAALSLCAAIAGAQESREPPAMSPEERALVEKWSAFTTPGAEHAWLAERVGTWTARVKVWATPDSEPQIFEGTAEYRMILGGRFLEDRTTATFDGGAFEGLGYTGFDNLKKKFVYAWMDSMGTSIFTGEATLDPATGVLTSVSEAPDLATGKYKKIRGTETRIDANTFRSEMFDTTPDGKEFRSMESVYRRK